MSTISSRASASSLCLYGRYIIDRESPYTSNENPASAGRDFCCSPPVHAMSAKVRTESAATIILRQFLAFILFSSIFILATTCQAHPEVKVLSPYRAVQGHGECPRAACRYACSAPMLNQVALANEHARQVAFVTSVTTAWIKRKAKR